MFVFIMTLPLQKKDSEATVTTMASARTRKTFVNKETRQRYASHFSHKMFTIAQIVDFQFFNKANIDAFNKFEVIGWGTFFALNEQVFSRNDERILFESCF